MFFVLRSYLKKNFVSFCLVITILSNTVLYSNLFSQDLVNKQQNNNSFIAGDAVSISTFPDTTSFLNNVFSIDDKGYVEFPIEGKVKITGMTPSQLENYLKETFKSWYRNPNIYVKPVVRISMLGGFSRPGLYYVDLETSLWGVVRLAGGPVLEKGIYDMMWERNGKEQDADLVHYFETGVSLRQIGFKSGDQIRTPSPDAETFWDNINNIMPLITISTTIFLAYITYQQSTIQYSR